MEVLLLIRDAYVLVEVQEMALTHTVKVAVNTI